MTSKLFQDFFQSEKNAGILLLAATFLSMILANSNLGPDYLLLLQSNLLGFTPVQWMNEVFMCFFFLMIGLEIERELYAGELTHIKKSMLPISAAIGGMVVPVIIYLLFNSHTPYSRGFGIPMATDIAFSLTILSVLGTRVPLSAKIFLTLLAIVDDLGAILVIALSYHKGIHWIMLGLAALTLLIMWVMQKCKFNRWWHYGLPGIALWYFIHEAGLHATLAGVILAFMIPFHRDDPDCPSFRLLHLLHIPVAFGILPLFALVNTAMVLTPNSLNTIFHAFPMGIALGMLIGKPLGVFLFSFLAVKFRIAIPWDDLSFSQILGLGILAGIGFTMSIFISTLAFDQQELVELAKWSILITSTIAASLAYFFLKKMFKQEIRN